MGVFLSSCRKAESVMRMGGAAPGVFASVLRMQNAARPRSERTLILASAQGNFGFWGAAIRMRRYSLPRMVLLPAEMFWSLLISTRPRRKRQIAKRG